jgi:hypothetical protein
LTQLEPGEGNGSIGGGTAWERQIDAVLGVAASAILFGLMTLTFADVMGRYLFSSPVRGWC